MTTTFNPERMVAEARYWAERRYHEGGNNANVFSLWQYGNSFNPWCDSFVCYCAYVAGFRFPEYSACKDKGEYNVGTHHHNAMREGIWRGPDQVARPGWLVVLSFTEADQHIEMVLSDQGKQSLATIGGNTGDAVLYRIRSRRNVVGFIALDEAGQNTKPEDKPKVEGTIVKSTDKTWAAITKNGGRAVLGADGGVFCYGDKNNRNVAPFFGSLLTGDKPVHLNMTNAYATNLMYNDDETGYWILGLDGGVFALGAAPYLGNFTKDAVAALGVTALRLIHDGHGGYKAVRSDGFVMSPRR